VKQATSTSTHVTTPTTLHCMRAVLPDTAMLPTVSFSLAPTFTLFHNSMVQGYICYYEILASKTVLCFGKCEFVLENAMSLLLEITQK